jgi:hypothetical protein
MDLKEKGWEGVDWINLILDKDSGDILCIVCLWRIVHVQSEISVLLNRKFLSGFLETSEETTARFSPSEPYSDSKSIFCLN